MPSNCLFSDARAGRCRRRRHPGPRRRDHARPDRPECIISKSFGGPTVTKDGVTVSKEIELPDPFENMGAKLVNVVALEDLRRGRRRHDHGHDPRPRNLSRGLGPHRGATPRPSAAGSRRRSRRPWPSCPRRSPVAVSKKEEIAQVATISANNDPTIGKLLADAVERVGRDGVITVEEGKTSTTTLEFVEGMQFDKGYLSPYFVTSPTTMEVDLRGPADPAPREEDQQPARARPPAREGRAVGPAAVDHRRGVEGEALATLVVNKLRASSTSRR